MKNLLLNLSVLLVCGLGFANSGNDIQKASLPAEEVNDNCCTRYATSADGSRVFSHEACQIENEDPCRLALAGATAKARLHDLKEAGEETGGLN